MGPSQVVWGRGQRKLGGVLGAIRIRQRDLDPCSADKLEPDYGTELGICRRRLCHELRVFGPKSVAGG